MIDSGIYGALVCCPELRPTFKLPNMFLAWKHHTCVDVYHWSLRCYDLQSAFLMLSFSWKSVSSSVNLIHSCIQKKVTLRTWISCGFWCFTFLWGLVQLKAVLFLHWSGVKQSVCTTNTWTHWLLLGSLVPISWLHCGVSLGSQKFIKNFPKMCDNPNEVMKLNSQSQYMYL